MALIRNLAQPAWQAECWGFSGKAEKNAQDLAHASVLVFAVTAVATGIFCSISLSSEFGIGVTTSFIVVAVLFPLLCGSLARERWRAKRLEQQATEQQANLGLVKSDLEWGNNFPAGLLIVSPDLRIHFANQAYLQSTFQEPQKILGWKIQDVLTAEGIEDQANALLGRSDPAASWCFNTLIRNGLADDRPVHITMARVPPQQVEGRILVFVEDLHQGCSLRPDLPGKGYAC